MWNKIIKVFQYSLLSFLLLDCDDSPRFPAGERTGYKPIYAASASIVFGPNQVLHKPGKIRRYNNYLLISEFKSGVHVFDNTDPSNPAQVGFLNIADNVSMEVVDHFLIVDYQNHIVSLDIMDISKIVEVSRVRGWNVIVPPVTMNYYECPDPSKEVIGWKLQKLDNPKCYR